ncbi:MAG: hypothetical protein GY798_24730 [Hyphomicrobiales bacterium]|nr:hypothetical protein [Hyphomicrobiales bacterium]
MGDSHLARLGCVTALGYNAFMDAADPIDPNWRLTAPYLRARIAFPVAPGSNQFIRGAAMEDRAQYGVNAVRV